MLQTRPHFETATPLSRPDEGASLLKGIDLVAVMAMVRRHMKVTAICVALSLAAFLLIGFLSDTRYTAQVSVLIGNRQIRAVQEISAQSNAVADASQVDNQTEVFKSERVLLAAIEQLKLMDDPEFNGTEPPSLPVLAMRYISMLNPLRLFAPAPSGDADPMYRMRRTVVGRLSDAMKITRAGKSNVLQIAVTAKGPRKAAAIANGVAQAYLADQVDARVDAAKLAGDWFKARLEQLRQQSVEASRAVEQYRVRNNLVATNGQLVSDQQFNQLNNDLAVARAEVVQKQARYDNLRAVINRGQTDTLVTEALQNSVVAQLRQRSADVSKRYNEIVARLGANHETALNLRKQITEYDRLIFEELRRFLGSYESELNVAKERQATLARQIADASSTNANANAAMVQLRSLEQEATALTGLYQNFLGRYQETIQQESFPVNDARIITEATAPLVPSEPRMTLLAALGIILGLGVGAGIGAFRELSDHAFRTAEQTEEYLGVDVFGLLPKIENAPVGTYAIKHPFSSYAETLRAVKIGLDGNLKGDRAKVVGIVSSIPREGKSTLSMNFASLLAFQGSRVVLIDADLREAGLTRLAGLKPASGLGEVLANQAQLSEVLATEPNTGLTIIPATVKHNAFLSGDLIASPAMDGLLKALSERFDYVIVDLPPIGPVIDGRAAAHLLDAVLLLVEWGNVSRRVVRNALAASPAVRDKLIGAVLNKVEVKKLKAYEPYLLDETQEETFNRYYK